MKIELLDTTLRDGAQGEGISFSVEDKINIIKALDEFGVPLIEAGNPASNPKDEALFSKLSALPLVNARIAAFGSTRRKDIDVRDDEAVRKLAALQTKVIVIFGKCSDMQALKVLCTTKDENLKMIFDTVAFLTENGKEVIFDAEHFFDGYKSNPEYAIKAIKTAEAAGAKCIVLCDTNGGSFLTRFMKSLKKQSARSASGSEFIRITTRDLPTRTPYRECWRGPCMCRELLSGLANGVATQASQQLSQVFS